MALARTDLLGQVSADNHGTGAFTTSAFTPPSSSLLVVAAYVMENIGTTDPSADMSVSGGGWTYTSRLVFGTAASWSIGLRIWTAPVSTGVSMTLALDCAARNIYCYAVSVVAYTGYDTGSPTGATGTVVDTTTPDGAQTITLSGAPATTSEVIAALGTDKESVGVTPGSGWTEVHDVQAGVQGGIETQVRTGSASTSVAWVDSHTGTGTIFKCIGVALEIKESAAGTPGAPARRRPQMGAYLSGL